MEQNSRMSVVRRNFALYAVREAFYNTALLFVNGTLIQLYLSEQGVSSAQIGMFNTMTHLINVAVTMLFSGMAERKPNALRQSGRMLLPIGLAFALYLPLFFLPEASPGKVLFTACIAAATQMAFVSCKGVFEYKMLYQIIDIEHYGALAAISGIAMGLAGAAFSWGISTLVDKLYGTAPFVAGILLSAALMLLAMFLNGKMKVVNASASQQAPVKMRVSQVVRLFRTPEFGWFILPNALRGITLGVLNSIVLLAVRFGVSAANTARIAAMSSLGYIAGSVLYYLLDRRCQARYLGVAGGLLVSALVLLPWVGKGWGFLAVYMISYVGRVIVDYAVPVMVFRMIDPRSAGLYNAWRNTLLFLTAAASTAVFGALVDHVNPMVFLGIAGGGYVLSAICYAVLYPRFAAQTFKEGTAMRDPCGT